MELKRHGAEVTILESENRCGGRIFTNHFEGLSTENGGMRLPGYFRFGERYKDINARVYHYMTDWYVEKFDLKTMPFRNIDANTYQFVTPDLTVKTQVFQDNEETFMKEHYPNIFLGHNIQRWNDANPNNTITTITQLYSLATVPIQRELTDKLDALEDSRDEPWMLDMTRMQKTRDIWD